MKKTSKDDGCYWLRAQCVNGKAAHPHVGAVKMYIIIILVSQTNCGILNILFTWFDIGFWWPQMALFFSFTQVGMKDFCLKDTDTEDSNWAVISPFTDQSAAPVMMLCCHAMQTNYIFLCRKMPKICNNSYSIMDCSNSLHVSAIIEMQCTLTLTCILIPPHWCFIKIEHWDATTVLPCSLAA